MKKIFVTLALLLPFVLTSCYYDKYQDLYGPAIKGLPSADTAGVYSTNVQKIFAENCISCHNDQLSSGGHSFSTWQKANETARSGRLLGAIKWQPGYIAMPQGGNKLDSMKIIAIENWMSQGAPDN
jgi:hypothetical protein